MSQSVVPRKIDNEYATPWSLYESLCAKYGFYPILDVCATQSNKKCEYYIPKHNDENVFTDRWGVNGLSDNTEWHDKNWMNPPQSETELWVKKACKEFVVRAHETMAIIAANSMCTTYAEACIKPHAEYDMIFERPKFKKDGEHKESPINAYFVVIWRKK